jgi:hypothetical protein
MTQFITFDTKDIFLAGSLKPCSPPDHDCPICLNTLETDLNKDIDFEAHTAVTTLCGHVFGSECICKWNMQSNTCPMCVRALFVKEVPAADYIYDPISLQEEAERLSYRLEALLELLYEERSHEDYRVLFTESTISRLSSIMMVLSRALPGFEDLYDGVGFTQILPTMSAREKGILYAEMFDMLWHLVGFCERQTWDYGSEDEDEENSDYDDSDEEDEENSDDNNKNGEDEEESWFRGSDDDDCWGEGVEDVEEDAGYYYWYMQVIEGSGYEII